MWPIILILIEFIWKYLQLSLSVFWQTKDFCLLPMYCRLEDFVFDVKKASDLQHMDLPRTGSYMGSADT